MDGLQQSSLSTVPLWSSNTTNLMYLFAVIKVKSYNISAAFQSLIPFEFRTMVAFSADEEMVELFHLDSLYFQLCDFSFAVLHF